MRRTKRQGELPFKSWGGPRPGSGRKPKGDRAGVSHLTRSKLSGREPVHVTVRLMKGLPLLRDLEVDRTLRDAFVKGCDRFGFRMTHYSIQNDHLHLIAEMEDRTALSRGMQGLLIRIAKALNKLWGRKGRVFADRYHDHVLESPREVRNAIAYVLHNWRNNGRKHGRRPRTLDRFSSGPWFEGWKERVTVRGLDGVLRPIAEAVTWLLRIGWRRHGLIGVTERPGTSS